MGEGRTWANQKHKNNLEKLISSKILFIRKKEKKREKGIKERIIQNRIIRDIRTLSEED